MDLPHFDVDPDPRIHMWGKVDPDPRIHLSGIVDPDPDPRIHPWKKWIRIRVPSGSGSGSESGSGYLFFDYAFFLFPLLPSKFGKGIFYRS